MSAERAEHLAEARRVRDVAYRVAYADYPDYAAYTEAYSATLAAADATYNATLARIDLEYPE